MSSHKISTFLFIVAIGAILCTCVCLLLYMATLLPEITGETLTGLCSIVAVQLTFIYKALLCLRGEKTGCGNNIDPTFLKMK